MLKFKELGLLLLLQSAVALSVSDFKPALFRTSRPSGFYNVDTGSPNSGEVLALADLNGDKYTDYIATNNRSQPYLTFYYWNDKSSQFSAQDLPLFNTTDLLSEIMVCDINADGFNEIVVSYSSNNTFYSRVYSIKCDFNCSLELWNIDYSSLENMEAVPFIFDRFSNGSVSIYVFQSQSRVILTAPQNQRSLYSLSWTSLVTSAPSSFQPVSKHFASMLDINGDCFSDIVLVSGSNNNILEIYTKNHLNGYDYSILDIGKNITWVTFADLNADGSTDIFIVANENSQYKAYVLKNANVPKDLCLPFSFPSYQIQNLKAIVIPAEYTLLSDSNIKIADFNFDGFPDLIGIFSINSYRTASILVNNDDDNPFTFNKFDVSLDPLHQVNNPYQVCLYDFTESGKISILVISQVTKSDGTQGLPRTSIINNIIEDTLFIKILSLLPSSSDDFQSNRIISSIGVTIQWRITNLNGDKTISVLNQKSQWNYGSLQLPFSTNGLGRTNNYIEDLTVGYPGYGMKNSWTPIIPNSQLILVGRSEQDAWVLQTLLRDNSRVYDTIYISILCLVGLGLLVVFLNWKQNQEDKRDHYNFIQMIR